MELLCWVDICIPAAPRCWQKRFAPLEGHRHGGWVVGAGFWHFQTIQGSSVSTAEVFRESTKMDVGANVTSYRTIVILCCLSKGARSHQPLPWLCRLWTQHQLCPPSTGQEPLSAPAWLLSAATGHPGGSNPIPAGKPSSPRNPFPIQTTIHPPRHYIQPAKSSASLKKHT